MSARAPVPPRAWLVPLAAVVALAWLADPARNRALFLAINGLAAQMPDALWASLTVLGDTLVALSLLLILLRRRPDLAFAALLAALPALLLSHGLKAWVGAARPAAVLGDAVHVIGPLLKAGAFPSGHTTTAFVLAAVLALGLRSAGMAWVVLLAALLAGLSRIAVGAHWPADVLGGILCGWAAGLFGLWAAGRLAWEQRPRVLATVRLFLVACALVLFLHYDSGYPQARPFEQALALAVLLAGLWPVGGRRARG